MKEPTNKHWIYLNENPMCIFISILGTLGGGMILAIKWLKKNKSRTKG